jgi:hypothetical protein
MIGNKIRQDAWAVEGTGYMAFQNFNFAALVRDPSEKDRLRYEARIIIRRLEQFIAAKERKKLETEEFIKTVSKPGKILKGKNIQRQIERQIEASKKPIFTYILVDKESKEEIEHMQFGETILKPELMVITLEEVRKRIEHQ